jgi:mono/diheme cytochrome c family protein
MFVIPRAKLFFPALSLGLIAILASPACVFASKKDDEAKAGAVLFRDKGCTYCHGEGAVGTKKAPSLTVFPKDKTWTNDKITDQILNGGKKMPPFRDSVTDEEVSQLIAYLRAKNKPVPPPAASQDSVPASSPQ